jgi:predicted phosphodiesterase
MRRVLIASDWHLGTYSDPVQGRLALRFLEHVRATGDRVILNGDVFEGLFEPTARAERAHDELRALIAGMTDEGVLTRVEGNHDPGAGVRSVVLEHERLGRVLVTHGHLVDPVHESSVGNFGDGISRRFGHLPLVRGAARLAEAVVAGAVAAPVDRVYRRRCLALVERERCTFGVFGHNHRRHLAPGDRYANAGCLRQARLEYLVLEPAGASLHDFTAPDAAARTRAVS